jgi:hypothetical protein
VDPVARRSRAINRLARWSGWADRAADSVVLARTGRAGYLAWRFCRQRRDAAGDAVDYAAASDAVDNHIAVDRPARTCGVPDDPAHQRAVAVYRDAARRYLAILDELSGGRWRHERPPGAAVPGPGDPLAVRDQRGR